MPDKLKLTESRVQRFTQNVRDEYERATIIREVIRWRERRPSDPFEFVQIGMRFRVGPETFVERYSAGSHYYSSEIFGLGRNIAIGEEKYLVKMLQKTIRNRRRTSLFSLSQVSHEIDSVNGLAPECVFIPIDFFTDLHSGDPANWNILHDGSKNYLLLGGRKLRVFWSNIYVPFKKWIFVDPELSEWIIALDETTRHWVTVEVEPKNERSVSVLVKTMACYHTIDPSAGLVLDVPMPRKVEHDKSGSSEGIHSYQKD